LGTHPAVVSTVA